MGAASTWTLAAEGLLAGESAPDGSDSPHDDDQHEHPAEHSPPSAGANGEHRGGEQRNADSDRADKRVSFLISHDREFIAAGALVLAWTRRAIVNALACGLRNGRGRRVGRRPSPTTSAPTVRGRYVPVKRTDARPGIRKREDP